MSNLADIGPHNCRITYLGLRTCHLLTLWLVNCLQCWRKARTQTRTPKLEYNFASMYISQSCRNYQKTKHTRDWRDVSITSDSRSPSPKLWEWQYAPITAALNKQTWGSLCTLLSQSSWTVQWTPISKDDIESGREKHTTLPLASTWHTHEHILLYIWSTPTYSCAEMFTHSKNYRQYKIHLFCRQHDFLYSLSWNHGLIKAALREN